MTRKKIVLAAMTAITVLVSSGAIAFASADTTAGTAKSGRGTYPTDFVSLTETQREAVQQARISSMEEAVANLVKDDILTQEEADSILEIQSKLSERKGNPQQADQEASPKPCRNNPNVTEEQREALLEEMQSNYEAGISALVDEGTITQEQADIVLDADNGIKDSLNLTDEQREDVKQVRRDSMKQALETLVKDGILMQEEIEKEPVQKEAGACQNLSDDQRTALQEEMQSLYEAALSELVDEGTITQEQADQLVKSGGAWLHRGPGLKGGNRQGIGPGNASESDEQNITSTTL
jgi:predicted transcriptional regulator